MKIGLVGYQGSGKTTLFTWLTNKKADTDGKGVAMATDVIPEPRIDALCEIYHPKKVTYASLEIVDTPGLSRDQTGNVSRLGHLRETDYLVCVVPTFDGSDVQKEIDSFLEEMIFADLEIAANRLEKVHEQQKRHYPKEEQEKLALEAEILEKIKAGLESGHPVKADDMTPEEYKATRSFR